MLSPETFEEEYPLADLEDELPDAPVSSLRDLQYLYGTLYTLATTGGGDYAQYLTPDAAGDLVDEPDSLVVVRVDLSGESPQLADDDRGPAWVTSYTDDRIEKVAHCKYPAARGIDHSVTHQSGQGSDPKKLARYAEERLSKWATDDVVQSVADDHEDGWIVDALAELGRDEGAVETIEEATTAALNASTTALLTVKVRLDEDEGYLWPNERDVFLAAMRRRKLSKLVSKNQATDSSGEATDLVTNADARTVGTAEDPLNYFLGKQLETFPGLDPDEAWRSHPISEDAAVTLMNADTFVDACTYGTFGARVYYLPYFFGTPTADRAYRLYELLYEAATADGDDEPMTQVELAYLKRADEEFDDNRLRFYVSAVMPHQMSRYDVFGETMNAQIQYPASVVAAHQEILETAAFTDGDKMSAALPTHENWPLLADADQESLLHSVATGWYFAETFPEGDDDTDASADDPRIRALVAVLGGGRIPVSLLLDAYVDRIEAETDDENGFPVFHVAQQYAQLCALASADHDFLSADDSQRAIIDPPSYGDRSMTDETYTIADGGNPRADTLESFIEDTPALEDDERRASFLLGALVGAVANHQEFRLDRSTTLVDQFPVKSVTRNRIKKVTEDAVGKALTYTRQDKKAGGKSYSGTKFAYVTDRLRESILQTDPSEWDIETEDLRFYYALGVTYGMNDYSTSSADDTEATEATQH